MFADGPGLPPGPPPELPAGMKEPKATPGEFAVLRDNGFIRSLGACAARPPMNERETAYYHRGPGRQEISSWHPRPPIVPSFSPATAEEVRAEAQRLLAEL